MGITKFIYLLIIISIVFLSYNKDSDKKIIDIQKQPLVILDNSTIYDISEDSVNKVVQLKKAYIYDNYEESFETTIVTKEKGKLDITTLSGNHMIKIEDDLFVFGDVHLNGENNFNLKTEELQYNGETKIAKNSTDFILQNDDSKMIGRDLYMNSINKHVVAKRTHFEIKLKETDEIK